MATKILPEDLFGAPFSSDKRGEQGKSRAASRSVKKDASTGAARGTSGAKPGSPAAKARARSEKGPTRSKTAKKTAAARVVSAKQKKAPTRRPQAKKKAPAAPKGKTAAGTAGPKARPREVKAAARAPRQAPEERKKTPTKAGSKKPVPDLELRGEFPWEHPDREGPRMPCPACNEPVYPDSTVCIHCGAVYMECPHCHERAAALYNPKMATEQRLNKIFKQYTLFSIALPSMPVQDIMDCSSCRKHLILCEACRSPMKVNEEKCPDCGHPVRKTRLLMNPLAVFEALFRKPDLSKSVQRAVEDLLRSLSEW